MRVNELAKQLGKSSTDVLAQAKTLGMELTHHSNALSPEQVVALGGKPVSENGAAAAHSPAPAPPAAAPPPPAAPTQAAAPPVAAPKPHTPAGPPQPSNQRPAVTLKPGLKPVLTLRPGVKPGPAPPAHSPANAPRPTGTDAAQPGESESERQKRVFNMQRRAQGERGPTGPPPPQGGASSGGGGLKRPPVPGQQRPPRNAPSLQRPPRPGSPEASGPRFAIPGNKPRGFSEPSQAEAAPPMPEQVAAPPTSVDTTAATAQQAAPPSTEQTSQPQQQQHQQQPQQQHQGQGQGGQGQGQRPQGPDNRGRRDDRGGDRRGPGGPSQGGQSHGGPPQQGGGGAGVDVGRLATGGFKSDINRSSPRRPPPPPRPQAPTEGAPTGPPPPLMRGRGGGGPSGGGGGGGQQGKKLIDQGQRRAQRAKQTKRGGRGGPPPLMQTSDSGHVKLRRQRGRRIEEETRSDVKRNVQIPEFITIKDLSAQTGVKSSDIIRYLFQELSVMATINLPVDRETAGLVCEHLGIEYVFATEEEAETTIVAEAEAVDSEESLKPRPPVVTVMGHVDHGKTKLLDAIRSTNVVAGESGGITQHIGAYRTFLHGKQVTFIDTPGHQAFTAMRARGAKVTDIAVLVVAADDGVMPQTKEAIDHAKSAGVEIIVALNKIDKENANPEKVKAELAKEGLTPSEWGGTTTVVPVSALKKEGIQELLEMILLQAEMMDLKANPDRAAVGTILEARLDRGKGPLATVLIQKGSLKPGDYVVAGASYGRIRAMHDEHGATVDLAGPSAPVELFGLSDVPQAGDLLMQVPDEKTAREIYDERTTKVRQQRLKQVNRISLEDFHKRFTEGQVKELTVIIKADVQGTIEAMIHSLAQLATDEVKVNVVSAQVGNIKESDLMLAMASNSIIIGFKVAFSPEMSRMAQIEGIDVRTYDVIYDAVDEMKLAMAGLLAPTITENITGEATVRAIFKVAKGTTIGGCLVDTGKLVRNKPLRILREGVLLFTGVLNGLKRFKEDAREVESGYECGIEIDNFTDLKEGDTLQQFEVISTARTLE